MDVWGQRQGEADALKAGRRASPGRRVHGAEVRTQPAGRTDWGARQARRRGWGPGPGSLSGRQLGSKYKDLGLFEPESPIEELQTSAY